MDCSCGADLTARSCVSAHVADDKRSVTPRGHFGPATDFEQHIQWNGRYDHPTDVVFMWVVRALEGLT